MRVGAVSKEMKQMIYAFQRRPAGNELPILHSFDKKPGIHVITTNFCPVNFFELFITDDLFSHFAAQTNMLPEQRIFEHCHLQCPHVHYSKCNEKIPWFGYIAEAPVAVDE